MKASSGHAASKLVAATVAVVASLSANPSLAQGDPNQRLWTEVPAPGQRAPRPSWLRRNDAAATPTAYREFRLDSDALAEILATVPDRSYSLLFDNAPAPVLDALEAGGVARQSDPEIVIPLPDGTRPVFRLRRSSVMSPELEAKYPQLRAYVGTAVGAEALRLRMEVTPSGVSALILGADITVVVGPADPRGRLQDDGRYASYLKSIAPDRDKRLVCATPGMTLGVARPGPLPEVRWGETLRTYRLAVAATAEYVNATGGTKERAMAAIVRTINRVNAIYENELAIRFELVGDTDSLLQTNPQTLNNSNALELIRQSQSLIDEVIGDKNYDIGHTLSTGAGGRAVLGSVGRSGFKASGVTGSSNPSGDAFDVDYVAHEIGHQFGANHTFNGTGGSCSSTNWNEHTAYEPGSGSTLLSYAGICENDDLQANSDPYFHAASVVEITGYVTGPGETAQRVPTRNPIPSADAGPDRILPIATPFALRARASDQGGIITYSWEQLDLGRQSRLQETDDGDIPLFRSQLPTNEATRSFVDRSELERLPTRSRESLYRVTVRDNAPRGGAVATDTVTVSVTEMAGPFKIIELSKAAEGPDLYSLRWDVARTDQAPIGVDRVRILASSGNADVFDIVLADETPNDGSERVRVPNGGRVSRVRIESIGNVFFAESPAIDLDDQ